MQVEKSVFQRASHEEFHAEIVDLFCSCILGFMLRLSAAAAHHIPKNKGYSLIIMLIGSVFRAHAEAVIQPVYNLVPDFFYRQHIVHTDPSFC